LEWKKALQEDPRRPVGNRPITQEQPQNYQGKLRAKSLLWYNSATMTTFEEIMEKARDGGPVRFVIAQGADGTILEALLQADRAGFAKPILVGPGNEIRKAARERDISLNGWDIAEVPSTAEAAAEAVRIVAEGQGDILVKGLIQTADLLHAVLNKSNGLTMGRTLSHVGSSSSPMRRSISPLITTRKSTSFRMQWTSRTGSASYDLSSPCCAPLKP
jgi:hypothetical protein